jgi:hypothetical protein
VIQGSARVILLTFGLGAVDNLLGDSGDCLNWLIQQLNWLPMLTAAVGDEWGYVWMDEWMRKSSGYNLTSYKPTEVCVFKAFY